MNDDRNGSSTDGAFDVSKMLTPMFEFGATVMRMQQRMFAALLGTKDDAHDVDDELEPRAQNGIAAGGPEKDQAASPKVADDRGDATEQELNDVIAIRAEQISQSHPAGDPVGNWLLAEQEVLAERAL